MSLRIRVYGPSRNMSSFRAITRGYLAGFREAGADVDFCPTDDSLDETSPGGSSAPVGVLFGLTNMAHMMRHSLHKRRFVMIAPNSTAVPASVIAPAVALRCEVLSPSSWGKRVLENVLAWNVEEDKRPAVSILRHGVGDAFDPEKLAPGRDPGDSLRALHITSTVSSRKATLETAQAFHDAAEDGKLGRRPELVVESDPLSYMVWHDVFERRGLFKHVRVIGHRSVPWEQMGAHYREFDCVVQPSRSEGFGLCPLEAMCAGVPVIATPWTGHEEYVLGRFEAPGLNGLEAVQTGEPDFIEGEGDGAEAPTVESREIKHAFARMFARLEAHRDAALRLAPDMYARWRWKRVCADWLGKIERELT
jgi:hypothetical protein